MSSTEQNSPLAAKISSFIDNIMSVLKKEFLSMKTYVNERISKLHSMSCTTAEKPQKNDDENKENLEIIEEQNEKNDS